MSVLLVVCSIILVLQYPVYAEPTSVDTHVSIGIKGGELSVTAPSVVTGFPDVQLDATKQQTMYATLGKMRIENARGDGEKWRITAKAEPFEDTTNTDNKFEKESIILQKPSTITAIGTSSPNPTVGNAPVWKLDKDGMPVDIVIANANEGMGTYELDFPTNALSVAIPSYLKLTSPKTTFQTKITWSIVIGI